LLERECESERPCFITKQAKECTMSNSVLMKLEVSVAILDRKQIAEVVR
jgi:hypothetical protein